MHYLKNGRFPILIVIIFSLFSCQPNNNINKPTDATYTIDTIYITKSRDTGVFYSTRLWRFNGSIPLINIETVINGNAITYIDSSSGTPGAIGELVSRVTCVDNVIKSIYTIEPTFSIQDEYKGNVDFHSHSRLDSVVFYDLTSPFIPTEYPGRTFIPTYTNNNIDSLAVNIDKNGDLGFNAINYGNMLRFNYSSYDNQKNLIGLDVNEFLYLQKFFCKWRTSFSIIPYGQHLFFMDNETKSVNTNCKSLLNEIHSSGEDEYISYIFDSTHTNRIAEIHVNVTTATDNYIITYKFHYKS